MRIFSFLLGLCIAMLLMVNSSAEAACSGSGTTWSCTAGSTSSDVQSAVNSASDGAMITLANGSYSFTEVDISKRNGVTVICASVGGCTMTGSGQVFTLTQCTSQKTNLMRISGFNFTTGGGYKIWVYCSFDITKLRLDHLDITGLGSGDLAIFIGEGGSTQPLADRGKVYGVIDHVNCHSTNVNWICVKNTTGGDTWTTGTQGSGNALFFEDNICNFGTRTEFGSGCVDNWRAQSSVIRFNTVIGSVIRAHSYCHLGPQSMEVYGNVIDTSSVSSPGFWDIHLQGAGEIMIWGNRVTAGSTPIAVQNYRSDSSQLPQGDCLVSQYADGTQTGAGTPTDPNDGNRTPTSSYYGYPTWHQPGRDGSGKLKPMYDFLNVFASGGSTAYIQIESGNWTGLSTNCANTNANRINCHIQLNRDLYRSTTPFTGMSGVGVGSLANRPSVCTPTPESADVGNGGVGYWATDQGSWNQSSSNARGVQFNGADGVLYRCSATNTWTVAYTPYTYPHPLQTAGTGGGTSTTPPPSPTNLVVQ